MSAYVISGTSLMMFFSSSVMSNVGFSIVVSGCLLWPETVHIFLASKFPSNFSQMVSIFFVLISLSKISNFLVWKMITSLSSVMMRI